MAQDTSKYMTYDLTRAAGSAGYGFALCTLLIPITWASQLASDFESCRNGGKMWHACKVLADLAPYLAQEYTAN